MSQPNQTKVGSPRQVRHAAPDSQDTSAAAPFDIDVEYKGIEGLSLAERVKRDNILWCGLLIAGQIAFCVTFATTEWGELYGTTQEDSIRYGFARDVSVMVFFGFGFLMSYLRRYGLSALGFTLCIGAFTIQQSILWEFLILYDTEWTGKRIKFMNMIDALFCAASIMVAFGIVIGKLTPYQVLFMAFFQTIFYWINYRLNLVDNGAHDMGGSMVIHVFGTYFGLAVTWWVTPKEAIDHLEHTPDYVSDRLSIAGTLFLWIMYPSFNAAEASLAGGVTRALINTVLSLCGCVIGFAIMSRVLTRNKFSPVHLQNASLAGGVGIGAIADLPVTATGAITIGFIAGSISVLGFVFVDPFLKKCFGIHDVCGVHNLHGLPGLFAGVVSAVVVAITLDTDKLRNQLIAESETDFTSLSAGTAAGKQLICLASSVGFGIGGGFLVGAFLKLMARWTGEIPAEHLFVDRMFWSIPNDYDDPVLSCPDLAEYRRKSANLDRSMPQQDKPDANPLSNPFKF